MAMFFPTVATFPTEEVAFDKIRRGVRLAPFVAPMVSGKARRERGGTTTTFTPAYVKPTDVVRPTRLLKRLPGEALNGSMDPAQRHDAVVADILNEQEQEIVHREEWMCAQALTTGKIPVVGKGVNVVIDFGLTNKPKLTSTNVWGGTTAKPLKNLDDWVGQVADNGFANVDMAIMGKTALEKFVEDANVQKVLDNRRFYIGEIAPRDMPNGVRYVGHINSPALDIYTYTEKFLDDWTDPDEPALKPLIPDNMVLLMSSAADYTMAYGLCTYIDDVSKQWVSVEGRRLMRSYVEHNPDRRMLELQARPLPIPIKVDSWLAATVL